MTTSRATMERLYTGYERELRKIRSDLARAIEVVSVEYRRGNLDTIKARRAFYSTHLKEIWGDTKRLWRGAARRKGSPHEVVHHSLVMELGNAWGSITRETHGLRTAQTHFWAAQVLARILADLWYIRRREVK